MCYCEIVLKKIDVKGVKIVLENIDVKLSSAIACERISRKNRCNIVKDKCLRKNFAIK
jgi:hypothetical protein